MGRKSRYETHVQPFLTDISEWYELLTERQIAKKLGISVASWENYKKEHEELRQALQNGRERCVEELKETLKKKAKGYYYEETKTCIRKEGKKEVTTVEKTKKYAQPDTGAIHLLLKNLDPDWTEDDKTTLAMKQQKLDLEKQKAENENW